MAEGYEIRSHELATASMRVLVLAPEGDRPDFMEEMAESPRDAGRYRLICRVAERIQFDGVATCVRRGQFVRTLDGSIEMVEVRVPGKVIRVMAYVHGYGSPMPELVLLFEFRGHQGGNKIPRRVMDKARRLARIARETMEEE